MRAPLSMPQGDDFVALAQAGRTLAIVKPSAGQPGLLQIAPGETLDFSRISNETIALVKLGNRLVVLFQDRAYVVVDGLYLPDGSFTPQVRVALDSATTIDTAQFTTQFGVSSDEALLTAAGISVGPRGAGGVNLAAAPPSSALNPESSLTPGISGASSIFGALTADDTTATADQGAGAAGATGAAAGPGANPDSAAVTEAGVAGGNTAAAGVPNAAGNLLLNDTGSSNLTVTGVAAGIVAAAAGNIGNAVAGQFGTLTVSSAGTYSYAMNNAAAATQALSQGGTASDTFTYTVTDANGQSATTTVTVTVTGTNDAPVVTSGAAAAGGAVVESGTNLGVPVPGVSTATGTLTASDVDNGAVLSWSGNAAGTFGSFVIDPNTGIWTYTIDEAAADVLNGGQSVTEVFTATVTDEFGATATQLVTVIVNGANDTAIAPTLGFDLDTLAAGTGYAGQTDAEAARSQAPGLVPERVTNLGVSVGQTDEASPLDPRPHNIAVNLANAADRIVGITVTLGAVGSGNAGVLRVSDGFQTLPSDTLAINDGARVLQIDYAAGYSQADAATVLATLRFVNTDTTFLMDNSDRIVTITITDQNGNTSSAVATIPVAGDVTDFSGAAGINAFTGTRASDRIIGLDGDDVLNGGAGGNDYIDGGDDDDTIIAADGDNQLLGGDGDNTITAGNGDNAITAGSGDDVVNVGNGGNQISLGDGDNSVTAGNGDNTVTTGSGDDTINTGNGDDVITAGDGSNRIFSGGGDDRITTGRGDDVINSGAGSDRITAGMGDDDITTGSGGDTIVYNSDLAQIGFDTLRDFESGADTLEFSLALVGGGLAAGAGNTGELDAARFTTGASFTNADQRFRFDSGNNTLFYDADGSGAGQAEIALAMVETGTVVASDIRIA